MILIFLIFVFFFIFSLLISVLILLLQVASDQRAQRLDNTLIESHHLPSISEGAETFDPHRRLNSLTGCHLLEEHHRPSVEERPIQLVLRNHRCIHHNVVKFKILYIYNSHNLSIFFSATFILGPRYLIASVLRFLGFEKLETKTTASFVGYYNKIF